MIRSAITVSLVNEARGGPFVFWDDLSAAFKRTAELGFDAIEIFAPGPDAVEEKLLRGLVEQYSLPVAAVGTGAGMVKHGLSLTDADESRRQEARNFIRSMIDWGAKYAAPAIIGSMQGRWGGEVSREQAFELLAQALEELGQHAAGCGVPLLYEPLNRYETNLLATMSEGSGFLQSLKTKNIRLLADLFHMNIEEADVAQGLRDAGGYLGHVHFVDSNRRAAGLGHTDFFSIAAALRELNFEGYISAEAFPLPDSETAAKKTIESYHKYFNTVH